MSSAEVDWIFVGQNTMGGAALSALRAALPAPRLVVTRLATPDHENDVVAAAAGLPIIEVAHEALGTVSLVADVVVCCGWGARVPSETLSTARSGWLNLHPGELPQWAGSDPIGWQLADGADEITCTVHRMTERIDDGPVLATQTLRVTDAETGLTMRRRAGELLGDIAADWLLRPTPERYLAPAPQRTPPRAARALLVPADRSVADVLRTVRAFSPFPGALLQVGDRVMEVAQRDGDPVTVRCADGEIELALVRRAE